MNKRQGFTMVELLVVLIIVGILISVAAPMYFRNTNRAKATEAIAVMGAIRDAEREVRISQPGYFPIALGELQNPLPTTVTAAGAKTPATAGAGINLGVAQYFSNAAYTVSVAAAGTAGISGMFTPSTVQNFLISVSGAASGSCAASATDCAARNSEVAGFNLEMDNSGRVFVSYATGLNATNATVPTGWQAY